MSGFIGNTKCIVELRRFHREEDPNNIWLHYYAGINPPSKVIQGENQNVTATDNKCFTYICIFTNLQDKAIKFESISDFSILLCENVFNKGPGTVYIDSSNNNNIIIDKFCSFESKSTSGQFTYFSGKINSTILQGSISNGGNSSVDRGMIYQYQGFSSLSKTNISNCISKTATSFDYWYVESTTNVSFCNFENLEASQYIITQFSYRDGRIERCNYMNNSQTSSSFGLVYVYIKRLDILDSVFQNNLKDYKGKLFYSYSGQIYIYRCNVDKYSANSYSVYASEMTTESFYNDLKFIVLSPCEGKLSNVQNKDKNDSICIDNDIISLTNLFNASVS